jgi:glycosyltransferase involved in cell wall biosynthesis
VRDGAAKTDGATVVVPTRDRADRLRSCLEALESQTFVDIAVVVVDDGSVATRAVEKAVAGTPVARLIRTEHRGPAAARNAGVAAAESAFVCFTDDDCEPDPEWVSLLVARLRSGADVVAGTVENGRPDDPFSRAWHAIVDYLGETAWNAGSAFATSNNVACGIDVARAIPFDEAYERAAGEDRDWAARVAAAGYRITTEPSARVVHTQVLDLRRFVRQHFTYGKGAYTFRRSRGGIERPAFYLRLIGYGFARGFTTGLLVAIAQAATAAGFVAARADRQRPRLPH